MNGAEVKSGDIVRGGEVLIITVTPPSPDYSAALTMEGLTKNADGTYTVTAVNDGPTPSIEASFMVSTKYTLTVPHDRLDGAADFIRAEAGGESIFYDSMEILPGTTVTLTTTLKAGYVLQNLTFNSQEPDIPVSEDKTVNITGRTDYTWTFLMPNKDIDVSAVIIPIPDKTVDVQKVGNGTVEVNESTLAGSSPYIRLTATPDEGWNISSVQYLDGTAWKMASGSGGSYYFAPPDPMATQVSVRVTFVQAVEAQDVTISTEAELLALAETINSGASSYAGATVTLGADITLTGDWTPIGTKSTPFSGTFDGDGHTISGLSIDVTDTGYYGLFGYVDGPEIKNVTVTGAITSEPINQNASTFIGGVAGYSNATVYSNCASYVAISATQAYVGGIAGNAQNTSFTDCANHGALSIDTTQCSYDMADVGGIAGQASGNLLRCVNVGSISCKTATRTVIETGPSQGGTVETTPVEVHVSDPDVAAGGLVGTLGNGNITESANKGSVVGDIRYGGGLVGNGQNSSSTMVITNCYNTAEVRGTSPGYTLRDRIGGLVGTNFYHRYDLTLQNCYSLYAGAVDKPSSTAQKGALAGDLHANAHDYSTSGDKNAQYLILNSYAPADIAALEGGLTAALLNAGGSAWVEDETGVNLGRPMLAWESAEAGDEIYTVAVSVTPAGANVTVSAKADLSDPVQPNADGSYSLKQGGWYYRVEAEGYMPFTGTLFVSGPGQSITTQLRKAAQVTFVVTPSNADFSLTYGGQAVSPESVEGGRYAYTLYTGQVYAYSVYAEGYSSITREYEVPETPAVQTVDVTMSKPTELKPGISEQGEIFGDGNEGQPHTITAGGAYDIGDGATGILTISTSEAVVLRGNGVGLNDSFDDLYINCTQSGANLTLQNVFISNESGLSNTIGFTGMGNTLSFVDMNIIDQNTGATGYAMIHVGSNASLTVTGGTAYLYKRDQGAGIGGNGGASDTGVDEGTGREPEYNGDITISGATLYMKNSKQGALIGSGASAKGTGGTPGTITIVDSELNMITISRGAAIGGAAGSTGAASGSNVYVTNSIITINVDYSGAAIGGGGYDAGNDSDGGTLYYNSGSIRTYIDTNAVTESIWASFGVTEPGVNGNKAITAKVVNSSGNPLYLLELDTSALSGYSFTVKDGTRVIYSGGLHQYSYINEGRPKNSQASISYTMDNWGSLDDPNLYLYLTGEPHTLTIGSATVDVDWNSASQSFSYVIKNASGVVIGGGSGTAAAPAETPEIALEAVTTVTGNTATTTVSSESLADVLEQTAANTQIVIPVEIPEGETVTKTTTVLTRGDVGAIGEAEVSLKISSPLADVVLPSEALLDLAGTAGQQDQQVTITAAVQENGTLIEIAVNGTTADKVEGGLLVSLPAAKEDLSAGTVMVLVDAEGNQTVIKKSSVGGDCVLALVDGSCTVKAVNNAKTFVDVYASHWYAGAVDFAVSHELFNGISETQFDPTGLMTRGMLVTVLHRLEDVPEATVRGTFTDVESDGWFTDAVHWASENKIVTGYDENSFGPYDSITREQMAVMMYRYVKWLGLDVSAAGSLNGYADRGEISDWAEEAIQWAVGAGLMEGKSATELDPAGTATRAEVATILQRLVSLIVQ